MIQQNITFVIPLTTGKKPTGFVRQRISPMLSNPRWQRRDIQARTCSRITVSMKETKEPDYGTGGVPEEIDWSDYDPEALQKK